MKYNEILYNKIIKYYKKYGTTSLRYSTKHKDLQKAIMQLIKLTPFLEDKHKSFIKIKNRIEYLGLKNINKCKVCNDDINTFNSITCGYKCSNILNSKLLSKEEKHVRALKAAESRNYDEISRKRKNTMYNDINEDGKNAFSVAVLKASDTMRNIIDDSGRNKLEFRHDKTKITKLNNINQEGLNSYEVAAIKSVETRKLNGFNSAENYWNNVSIEDKNKRLKSQIKKMRETCENLGLWLPKEKTGDYTIYFRASKFKHGFHTTEPKELVLLKELGVFNKYNNTKGCVRDHLLSRKYGFENNIPVWIISHPANCEIIPHSENVRRSRTNDNQISLDELINKISNWD